MPFKKNSIVIVQCYSGRPPKQLFVYKQRPIFITFMGFNWCSSSITLPIALTRLLEHISTIDSVACWVTLSDRELAIAFFLNRHVTPGPREGPLQCDDTVFTMDHVVII